MRPFLFVVLSLVLLAPPAGAQGQPAAQCPSGWQAWTTYCYLFVNTTQLTWANAIKDCRDKQSHLLRVETLDEYTFIRKGIQLFPSDDYWTALNNLGSVGAAGNASTAYMWGDDEYPLASVVQNNWDREPNNNNRFNCAMMSIQATLSMGDCNERHAYICQMAKPSAGCQQNWYVSFGGDTCFFFSNASDWGSTKSWEDARKACDGMGSHLVTISTSDVQNFLAEYAPTTYYGRQQFWTGLNDRATEGSFQWVDGTQYTANAFAGQWRQEPNNLAGTEHCGAMLPGGKWNDADCTDTKNYICRQPLPNANSMAMNLGCGSWTRAGRSCISIYNSPLRNWTDARAFCQRQGGDLLKFDTETDSDWIRMQAVNGYVLKGSSAGFWIGLNDQAQENTFVWTDGSEPFGYILAWTQEPNRLVNYGPNCASMASDGRFLDEDCDKDYAIAACEEPSTNGACAQNWQSYNGHCYFFDGNNWRQGKTEALNVCKRNSLSGNPTFLIFETMDEYTWVNSILPGGSSGGRLFWTGLISTGGMDWIWDGVFQDPKLTQQIVTWDSEPNNWGGNEDCVEIIQAGTLNDGSCGTPNGYICQRYLHLPPITTLNPAGRDAAYTAASGAGRIHHHLTAIGVTVVVSFIGKFFL